MPRDCSKSIFVASRVVPMPKMRERCASLFGRSAVALFALALALTASSARAAARRIALIHASAELTRSVSLALYPWDIGVVEIDEPTPDANAPDALDSARVLARHHDADAIAWIERTDESATLWFFDATDRSLHSQSWPPSPSR
jgi:hypothetical protein